MMKHFLLLFAFIGALSCSNNPTPKPEKLLKEEEMVNIIFDLSILQAANGVYSYRLEEENIKMDQYIFDKYNIDSITFSQNQRYYATDLKKYKRIYKNVIEKLEREKQKNDELLKNADKVNDQKDPIPTK